RAVLYGGILIALGHLTLTFHSIAFFYTGLFVIIVGVGLLKPNASTMVGALYSEADKRRDAGFSIFYMGINLGALISPIVCGFLAQDERCRAWLASVGLRPESAWHWGFGASTIGMTIGVIQYILGGRRLGEAGLHPAVPLSAEMMRRLRRRMILGAFVLI